MCVTRHFALQPCVPIRQTVCRQMWDRWAPQKKARHRREMTVDNGLVGVAT